MKKKYAFDNPIQKSDFIEFSPRSLAKVNNFSSNVLFNFPRKDDCICVQNSYIGIEFEVRKQDNTLYVDNDQLGLAIVGPIALFRDAKLVTSSGKHL